MVAMPDYTLDGPDGPVRFVDVFDGVQCIAELVS
jgi:hypothetical protein